MSTESIGGAGGAGRTPGIFSEPSANGEVAPPPAAPLPGVPPMPADFAAPAADSHLRPDARRGARELS